MGTYFVSHHSGALEWAPREGIDAEIVEHLDSEIIREGDVVIGTLPVHLAGTVCEKGGRFFCLSLDLPADWRKPDLPEQEMRQFNARLDEYHVRKL